jgi:hypothetical protein
MKILITPNGTGPRGGLDPMREVLSEICAGASAARAVALATVVAARRSNVAVAPTPTSRLP